jgi:putative acetyltransferase
MDAEGIAIRVVEDTDPDLLSLVAALDDDIEARYPGHRMVGLPEAPEGLFALVAFDGAEPVGCAAMREAGPGIGEVKRMFVAPQRRRRGVGRALIAAVEREAHTRGYSELRLETGERQPEALALYASCGFARIPCFGEYVGSELSVCMGKTLGRGVEIATIATEDLPAISALHAYFWGEASDVSAMERALDQLAGDRDHILLAARIDGECVGTATGVVCHGLYGGLDSYVVVEDVVVDPSHRRRGVGTALLREIERRAGDAGCKQLILLTESVRSDAVALYASLGYEGRWTGFKKKL